MNKRIFDKFISTHSAILFLLGLAIPLSWGLENGNDAQSAHIKSIKEMLSRHRNFAILYTLSRNQAVDQSGEVIPEIKKLVLIARQELKQENLQDHTVRIYEEICWYTGLPYSKKAPIHNIGFTDDQATYYWQSESNSVNKSRTNDFMKVQTPPSLYLWLENIRNTPILFMLEYLQEKNLLKDSLLDVSVNHNTIEFTLAEGPNHEMKTIVNMNREKGIGSITSQNINNSTTSAVVDQFQKLENGMWIPLRGRFLYEENEKKTIRMKVLDARVNEEFDQACFQNFPWDDPKFNTKFNQKWVDGQLRRDQRILFYEHPSYFDDFFDISLQKALELFLDI